LKNVVKVTVNDVAELAGVSPSTVSRVISNNPKISQETRDKVQKCMEELGYYPNAIARSLARSMTGTIGVIMPTRKEDLFLNPFFPEALRGIVKGASAEGYDLLLSTNTEKSGELTVIKNFIRGSKVDGIILMSSKGQRRVRGLPEERGFPVRPHRFDFQVRREDKPRGQ